MKTVSIAYMIEAHTDVNQLIRLCDALIQSGDVFIHVDKKTNDDRFWNLLNEYTNSVHNVVVIKERKYVAWAGYSQVECFKSLLEVVLSSEKNYDRILLLSGLDYPVYSPRDIQSHFNDNKEMEYVCGYNITTCTTYSQERKLIYYHPFRDIPLPHKSILRRFIIGGSKLALQYLGLRRKKFIEIDSKIWDIYYGSSWIGLTHKCALYILEQLNQNKTLVNYFKLTYAPDELVVPTIVMNSEYAKKAFHVKELDFQKVTPLHYLNYKDCIWTYDEKDYDTIMNSGKMFFRKAISGKSEKLIEMIKKNW